MQNIRLLFALFFCSTGSLTWAGVLYDVDLNTTALIGHPAGPFSAAFQLTDGSFVGDGNNTVEVGNFQFGGGSVSGAAVTLGNVTGDLTSSVTLNDSTFLNFLIQQFTPGDFLSFTVSATTNIDSGGGVDEFSFSILDSSGQQIPTQGGLLSPFFDVFLAIDFNSTSPTVQAFGSDPGRMPGGGGPPITTGAPEVISVPEPNTLLLSLALCCAGLARKLFRSIDRSRSTVKKGGF
jgi:hypothetical protein